MVHAMALIEVIKNEIDQLRVLDSNVANSQLSDFCRDLLSF